MNACIFCRIISGELESTLVAENGLAVAFLDVRPVNSGHTLVIPRRHIASFTELTPPEVAGVTQLVQAVARALKAALPECEGISVSLADGAAAGQEVFHAHFHVIPRFLDDGFGWRRFGHAAERVQLDETALRIRAAMPVLDDRNA